MAAGARTKACAAGVLLRDRTELRCCCPIQWQSNAENPTRRVCRWTIEERCHAEPMVAQLSRQTEDAGAF